MVEQLKEKTAKGLLWGTINNGSAQLINLIVGILLARLLTPEDYGIVGVLAVFGAIASSLQNSGLVPALINIKDPTHNDYNAVFWFNITVSLTLYLVLFLCAPLIARFFHQPCLEMVSRYIFLGLPLQALSIASGAYMIKNMMNREIAIVNVTALLLSGLAAIIMAQLGYSYWSLVVLQLLNVSIITLGRFYYVPWYPSLKIDMEPVKKMLGFSVKLLFTSIANAINFHLLTLIFGRLLPFQMVGYYSQANKWSNMAKSSISDAIGQVAQTVIVSVNDEHEREMRVFRKLTRFTAFLSFPLLLGLALMAHEFILATIGEKWEGSVILLQILCLGGAFLPFLTLYQNLCVSHGRSDIYMYCNIGQIVAQLVIVLLLHRQGIVVIVAAYSALTILWLLIWQGVAHRLIGLQAIDFLKDITPFLIVSLAVCTMTYFLTVSITNHIILLLARMAVFAILYIGILKMLHAQILEESVQFILKKKR